MENYVREILYGYPLLKTVGEDYEIHIRNKALLSHGVHVDGMRLAEYLAGEILTMDKLSDEERILIEGRYFGKRKKLRDFLKRRTLEGQAPWSQRKFTRRQNAAERKVSVLLFCAGITQEKYLRDFASMDIFVKVRERMEHGS